jgi:hypothetical protein
VKPGTPKAAPHQRWKSTTISFGLSNCPENMAGAGVLPLVTAPTIANVRLHHMLIDGGAGLSIISYAAFKHLQIPESKLAPSRPFSEWAQIPSTRWGPSPCRSQLGWRRTSAWRTCSSKLRRLTSPSMPS